MQGQVQYRLVVSTLQVILCWRENSFYVNVELRIENAECGMDYDGDLDGEMDATYLVVSSTSTSTIVL